MQTSLEYYAFPGPITKVGVIVDFLDPHHLPSTVSDLCRLIQGAVLHPFEAHHYGVKIPRKRWKELDLCEVDSMLQRLRELDPAPFEVPRPPEKRLLGNCRDYATFLCAFLRAQRIPARVRYGFATYFEANFYTDHVVCEYWNEQQGRWILVDAQIDEVLRQAYNITINTVDLPQDAFLLAGRAWELYRSTMVDPDNFGISSSGPRGVAFIRTGVLREVAALNKVELLCQQEWDVGEGNEQFLLVDQLARWTLNTDTKLDQLRAIFEQGAGLSVPPGKSIH